MSAPASGRPFERPDSQITRRQFVRNAFGATIVATFPVLVTHSVQGKAKPAAPSNRITVGVIGCGPQGLGDMSNFLKEKDCQVVAVCDVKNDQVEQARNAVNKHYDNQDCRTYHDFREL